MKFKMNRVKYTIAIFTILGISGLLYASSFLQFGIAQNKSDGNKATSQKNDVGSIKALQNLTKGNQELLANKSSISNSSISGISKESLTTKPNMSNVIIKNQSGGQNQSQSGGHNQSQSGGQNKGPLDQLLGSLMGKK